MGKVSARCFERTFFYEPESIKKTLEYHKIIEKLTEYAASEPGEKAVPGAGAVLGL